MGRREKILSGFYGFLVLTILSGVGSVIMSLTSWGLHINNELTAFAGELNTYSIDAGDHWKSIEHRLDSIDNQLNNIDRKLDDKADKKP